MNYPVQQRVAEMSEARQPRRYGAVQLGQRREIPDRHLGRLPGAVGARRWGKPTRRFATGDAE